MEILVSDETVNNHGLIVLTSGGDFTRFKMNPIMLLNHIRLDANVSNPLLPIGNWKNLRVDGTKIFATPVFDMEDKLAKRIAGKYDRRVMRGASMGINPLQVSLNADGIPIVEKWELMEISPADIPSNKNSVALYNAEFKPIELKAVINMAASSTKNKLDIMSKFHFVPTVLGLAADAPVEEVQAELVKLNALSSTNITLAAENEALKARIAGIENAEVITLTDAAVADGRIMAAQKDHYLKLAQTDAASVISILTAMTPAVNLSDLPKKDVSDVVKHAGKTFKELQRDNPKALIELRAKDFQAFNALYKADFGKDYRA